jgi:hypothetical protein
MEHNMQRFSSLSFGKTTLSLLLLAAPLSACSPTTTANQPQTQQSTQAAAVSGTMTLPYEVGGMQTQSILRSQAEIRTLRATVDTQAVALNINSIASANGNTQVNYTMTGLPTVDANRVYTVEVSTAANEPLLGAVVSLQTGQTANLNINTRSTAVLIRAREKYSDSRLLNVNIGQIREVENDPVIVNIDLSVGNVLRGVGSLTRDILSGVGSLVGGILDGVLDRRRR